MQAEDFLDLDSLSARNRIKKLLEIEKDTQKRIAELKRELNGDALRAEILVLESKILPLVKTIQELQDQAQQRSEYIRYLESNHLRFLSESAEKRMKLEEELARLQHDIVSAKKTLQDIEEHIPREESLLRAVQKKLVETEECHLEAVKRSRAHEREVEVSLAAKQEQIRQIELRERNCERRVHFLDQWEDRLWTREHDVNMLSERVKDRYKELFPDDKINLNAFEPSHELLHEKDETSG